MAPLLMALWPCASTAQMLERHSFTNLNKALPDGSLAGVSDTRAVTSSIAKLSAVRVKLNVAGRFNGDLYAYVRHINSETTNFGVLLNRVGRTGANSAGYSDAGLNVTLDSTAANDVHVYQTITNPPAGAPLTGTWQPDGRNVNPFTVTDIAPRTTSLSTFTGPKGGGEWTLFLADVDGGATNSLLSWELELIGAVYPTITWATPGNIVYGTALSGAQLNASAGVSGTFAYSPPAGTILNAASNQTLSVTFTPTDTNNYSPVTTNVNITVLKAPLTITANNTNKAYGAVVPTFTAAYSGFVLGETPASLDTPVNLTTTATASSPVGTYPIVAGGASDANYQITFANGTLTVAKASLTITANNTNKVYGAAVPAFTATYSGFVLGETPASLDTPVNLTTTATASSPAGT
jgi:subtilisin-like proprotein convertase family protein